MNYLSSLINAQNPGPKAAIGSNLFKGDMCTNVSFQTIPGSLLHFEVAASVPEKPADSPQVGCSVIALRVYVRRERGEKWG